MEIIEEVMEKYASSTKIWNMSLGIESKICNGSMSDLGIFLDYIQDKYKVQIFVSSGNLNHPLYESGLHNPISVSVIALFLLRIQYVLLL